MNLINVYNKKFKLRKILTTTIVVADILAIVSCLVLFAVFAVQESKLMNVFGVLFSVITVVSIAAFIIRLFTKDKLKEQLINDIEKGNYSAEDILLIGEKTKVNLFDMALKKRCDELGLDRIPEWCVRDGVLPEKKE